MDPQGVERERIEGYVPRQEFRAELVLGLGRAALMAKRWDEAERRYAEVVEQYPDTSCAPEAVYWRSVCHYKATSDHTALGQAAAELQQKYPNSLWAMKASVWSH